MSGSTEVLRDGAPDLMSLLRSRDQDLDCLGRGCIDAGPGEQPQLSIAWHGFVICVIGGPAAPVAHLVIRNVSAMLLFASAASAGT